MYFRVSCGEFVSVGAFDNVFECTRRVLHRRAHFTSMYCTRTVHVLHVDTVHTHARTHTRTHARTYARTHTHTHTRTHACTHTHTHTHTITPNGWGYVGVPLQTLVYMPILGFFLYQCAMMAKGFPSKHSLPS